MKICAPEVKKYQLKVLKVLHAISIQFSSTCIAHCASSSTAFRSNESILMLVGVHLWCGQSDFHVRPQTDCLLFRVPAHSQQPASERAAHLALSRTSYTSELPQDCSFPCNPWTSIVWSVCGIVGVKGNEWGGGGQGFGKDWQHLCWPLLL